MSPHRVSFIMYGTTSFLVAREQGSRMDPRPQFCRSWLALADLAGLVLDDGGTGVRHPRLAQVLGHLLRPTEELPDLRDGLGTVLEGVRQLLDVVRAGRDRLDDGAVGELLPLEERHVRGLGELEPEVELDPHLDEGLVSGHRNLDALALVGDELVEVGVGLVGLHLLALGGLPAELLGLGDLQDPPLVGDEDLLDLGDVLVQGEQGVRLGLARPPHELQPDPAPLAADLDLGLAPEDGADEVDHGNTSFRHTTSIARDVVELRRQTLDAHYRNFY